MILDSVALKEFRIGIIQCIVRPDFKLETLNPDASVRAEGRFHVFLKKREQKTAENVKEGRADGGINNAARSKFDECKCFQRLHPFEMKEPNSFYLSHGNKPSTLMAKIKLVTTEDNRTLFRFARVCNLNLQLLTIATATAITKINLFFNTFKSID